MSFMVTTNMCLLLQHGAYPNIANKEIATPLYVAIVVCPLKCVVVLVEHGADLNKFTAKDVTPLIASAHYNIFQVISYLLTHGANVNAVHKMNESVLQIAHLCGYSKCVELLLNYGADESFLQGLEFGHYSNQVCNIYNLMKLLLFINIIIAAIIFIIIRLVMIM